MVTLVKAKRYGNRIYANVGLIEATSVYKKLWREQKLVTIKLGDKKYKGYVKELTIGANSDSLGATVAFDLVGMDLTGTVHDYAPGFVKFQEDAVRKFPAGKPTQKKMAEGLRQFYVGSNNLTVDWTHADLATAVEHAQELVRTAGGPDEAFVVEIRKVVKRPVAPVKVVDFKTAKAKRKK